MRALLCALLIAFSASGAPASRLQDADVCNGWYKDWDPKTVALMQDMPFVVGAHLNKATIGAAHKRNARVLQYVSFYQMPPGREYQGANISEHPDWACIHPDGSEGKSTQPFQGVRWTTTCPNSPGYRDHVLNTVTAIMKQGADGLFIDNAHPDIVCEGPKFGRHKHLYPGKDNIYAYRKLLEQIRREVAKYGPDKLVIMNGGNPRDEWMGACDGQVLESFICSWAWKDRWIERKILRLQGLWGAWRDKGCPVVAISYIGFTKNPPREDAFYCYAWARLCGFIWADWFTAKDSAADLYKLRLGKALGPMQTHDGYFSREYKNGLVVTTSQAKGASFRVNAKAHPRVLDFFTAQRLKPGRSHDYEITLPAGQGRVYVYR